MAASTGLLAGYCGLAVATGLAIAVGGTRRHVVALGVLGLAVLVVAMRTSWPASLGVGALGWLFYDGFFVGRHAHLAWHGVADLRALGALLGAAAGGIAVSWARGAWARGAWARGSWRHGFWRHGFWAAAPASPGGVAAVISLAEARAARQGLRQAGLMAGGVTAEFSGSP
jgi:hypothetical protein